MRIISILIGSFLVILMAIAFVTPANGALNSLGKINLLAGGAGARYAYNVCADQTAHRAFLSGDVNGNILALNMNTHRVEWCIHVGGAPSALDVDESTQDVCFTLPMENSMGIVPESGGTVARVATGGGVGDPLDVVASDSTGRVYVSNYTGKEIVVVKRPENTVETRISLPADSNLVQMAIDHSRLRLYVGCVNGTALSDREVLVISVNPTSPKFHTIVDQFSLPKYPGAMAMNESTNRLYIGGGPEMDVMVLDLTAREVRIIDTPTGIYITGVAVDPAANTVWACGPSDTGGQGGGWVFKIDGATEQVTQQAADYDMLWGEVAADQTNQSAFFAGAVVAGWWDGVGTVQYIPVSFTPTQIAIDTVSHRLWTGDYTLDVVHEANLVTNQVIRDLTLGEMRHRGVAYDPAGCLYATCWSFPQPPNEPHVQILDAVSSACLGSRTLEGSPEDVAVNPVSKKAYIANTYASTISVLDIDPASSTRWQVIKTITVDPAHLDQPTRLAVDPVRNVIYCRTYHPLGESHLVAINGRLDEIAKDRVFGPGYSAFGLAALPDLARVYVGCLRPGLQGGVDILDGDPASPTFLDTLQEVSTPDGGYELCAGPVTDRVYISCLNTHRAYSIDGRTGRVISGIETEPGPTRIAIDPTTNKVYIGSPYSSSILVIQDVLEKPTGKTKALPDGAIVELSAKPVTAGTDQIGGDFYIEETNCSSGIRVRPTGMGVISEGSTVNVVGTLATLPSGERIIDRADVSPADPEKEPSPVGMCNRGGGGGDFVFAPGPPFRGQQGVAGGVGLNNIGLLVRTWGRVESQDPASHSFVIDDGSGVHIKCAPPATVGLPDEHHYAIVTGISSCEIPEGQTSPVRLLLPRCDNDVIDLGLD